MNVEPRVLGIYIHIPFCKSKCAYCDFYSLAGREEDIDVYIHALCTHLISFAPQTVGYIVDTIYFGGGTPSYLGETRLLKIFNTIIQNYNLSADAEITLEANPDSVGEWMKTLYKAGFNRLSLGMQSGNNKELQTVGRIHTVEQVYTAVEVIRKAGFQNLSLDLIYGLPFQTMKSWEESISAAVFLAPEHLSCYGLKIEKNTPLYTRRNNVNIPGDEEQANVYLWTVEKLESCGYEQYEISNFAKSGYQSRHNLKYWTLQEYIGFGCGAHSDFKNTRFAIARDLSIYMQNFKSLSDFKIDATEKIFSEYTPVSFKERQKEWIMLGLRTAQGLDPNEYNIRFAEKSDNQLNNFQIFLPFLSQCEKAGYAQWKQGRISLTPRGFLVSNLIIGEMLADC